jgi:RTA1 like protein
MPYIIQNFFILVAPALFAASIYMTLGRIIRAVKGESLSLVRINWLTKTFVIGDIMSFLVQGGSAGLMFSSSTVNIGQAMVVAGLFIQIIMFGLFALTAVIFQVCYCHPLLCCFLFDSGLLPVQASQQSDARIL